MQIWFLNYIGSYLASIIQLQAISSIQKRAILCFIGFQMALFSHASSTTQNCPMPSKISSFVMLRTLCQQSFRGRTIAMLWYLRMGHDLATGPRTPEVEEKVEKMFGQPKGFCRMGRFRICPSGLCTKKMECWKDIHQAPRFQKNCFRTWTGLLAEIDYQVKAGMTRYLFSSMFQS